MFDAAGMTGLFSIGALGAWLAVRARRVRNRVGRWAGLVLSSLLSLAAILFAAVALIGFSKIDFPPGRPKAADIKVAGTPDQVARGARLAVLCPLCHSPSGQAPLVGMDFSKGGPPVGTIFAPNLTPAGEIRNWSDGELIRAIREGVHKTGRALVIMPSEVFHNLSDADVEAIVAYLRAQPAAGSESPPARLNVLAAALIGAGFASTSAQQPITQPVVAPPEGTSAEYGTYLVAILGCRLCHGENLAGRPGGGPGPPAGPNLTVLLPKWSLDDFLKTFRTGVDPYNHTLTTSMPWKEISAFARDDDLKAIYAYLHGLTPLGGFTR
jgi:mono/diheme cytochrome c family protein